MSRWDSKVEVGDLKGLVFTAVYSVGDGIIFESAGGRYDMHHEQDCCEDVHIESIVGDLQDLVGHPILEAREATGSIEDASESGTWTFYTFATVKGYVDIRWNGYSNGYYSESVHIYKVK